MNFQEPTSNILYQFNKITHNDAANKKAIRPEEMERRAEEEVEGGEGGEGDPVVLLVEPMVPVPVPRGGKSAVAIIDWDVSSKRRN